MTPRVFTVLLLFACLAAGCGFVPRIPGIPPYRMEIQQGNYVSQEMVSQLKQGMTKEQVRFILGTPMVTDIFHAERWAPLCKCWRIFNRKMVRSRRAFSCRLRLSKRSVPSCSVLFSFMSTTN